MRAGLIVALVALVAAVGRGEDTAWLEKSPLFVRYQDPQSGVVSYILKPGLVGGNQQQLYFTSRSLTDDQRFLVIDYSDSEFASWGVRKPKKEIKVKGKQKAVIDLQNEKVYKLDGIGSQILFLDVERDEIYYANYRDNSLCKRLLKVDPMAEIEVCKMPESIAKRGKVYRYYTHLMLTQDRTTAFLDCRVGDEHIQGALNVQTGEYTEWCNSGLMNINHGQINPVRKDLALAAYECVPWTDSKGVLHDELRNFKKKHPGEWYPRLQLFEPGKRTMIPSKHTNYATHERWDEQGEGFYWCSGSVWYHELKTGEQYEISPKGAHAFMSYDRNYVVSDVPVGGWWRGCAWQVYFHNRQSNRGVHLFTYRPAMCPKETPSWVHPDPHPQFVCHDQYVICTINHADGHCDTAITPVEQLIRMTAKDPVKEYLGGLPSAADPLIVGKKLSEHFLETPPDKHGPRGVTKKWTGDCVPYAAVSLWINALEFAHNTADRTLQDRLVAEWKPFADGGAKVKMRSQPYHVDFTIFGAIPYEIYMLTDDKEALKLGNWYADTQWAKPHPDDIKKMPKWLQNGKHNLPYEEQLDYLKRGYSPQTRLWIDDMYMITVLQTQAYRATRNRKYLDRAVKEALLYLDKLQLKEGPVKGLFYHAPDVKYVWGRGDGWMAAGMPLMLKHLPATDPEYHKILAGYQLMMAALLKYQREDGLWGQLIDGPDSWSETSGSAMFCYGFIEGIKNGWLDAEKYGPAARKAWQALCGKLDEYGNLRDICIGTGKKDDRQYYLDRDRLVGDPHGQAPMLWCVNAMLEPARPGHRDHMW